MESTDGHITVTDDDVIDLWRTIGTSRNLVTDTDVARYLLSLYSTDKNGGEQLKVRCLRCSSPLTFLCINCQFPSQQNVHPQLDEHTQQQEATGELSPEQRTDSKSWSQSLPSQRSADQALLSRLPPGDAASSQTSSQQAQTSQHILSQRLGSPASASHQTTSSQCVPRGTVSSLSSQQATSLHLQCTSKGSSSAGSSVQQTTPSRCISQESVSQVSSQRLCYSASESESDSCCQLPTGSQASSTQVTSPSLSSHQVIVHPCDETDVCDEDNADASAVSENLKDPKEGNTTVPRKVHDVSVASNRKAVRTLVMKCTRLDSSLESYDSQTTTKVPDAVDSCELLENCESQTEAEVPGWHNIRSRGPLKPTARPTGEARIKYPICGGKAFKNGHIPAGLYFSEYKCSQCGKVFYSKINIKRHMKNPSCDDGEGSFVTLQKGGVTATAQGSHDDHEDWESGGDDLDSDSEKAEQKHAFCPYEKGFTDAEFMVGKIRIKRRTRGSTKPQRFSHYRCYRCCTIFVSYSEYKKHRNSIAVRNECTKREMPDAVSIKILTDIKEHHTVSCTKCSLLFIGKKHLQKHNQLHETDPTCHLCGGTFASKDSLQCHLTVPTEKQKCDVCRFSFQAKCQIKKHEKEHSEERQHKQCEICSESLDSLSKWKIKKHMEGHRNVFECQICQQTVPNRKRLIKKHMKSHEQVKRIPCPVCGKCFKSSHINSHISIHSDSKPFACTICNAAFKTKSRLSRHSQLHREKTKQCEYCGAEFHTTFALNKHVESHFGKKFRCEECGIRLVSKENLKRHMAGVHRKTSQHVCFCGQFFCDRSTLRSHMRSHTGEKPYQCKLCPAKFARNDYLTKHLRLHTGEKPHGCEDCGQRFAALSSLKSHRKKHHSDRTYTCSVCGLDFALQASLDFHVKRQHGFPSLSIDIDAKTIFKRVETCDKSATVMDSASVLPSTQGNDLTQEAEKAEQITVQ